MRTSVCSFLVAALVIAGLAGAATEAPPAHAAPGGSPTATVIRDCVGGKQIRPRTISSIFCGDAGVIVTDVTWLGWADGWAIGYGTEHRKLCQPSCAAGRSTSDPVGIWLFAPVRGAFTKVSLYHSVAASPETYTLTGLVR
ncbi:hypothetical protein QNM97_24395 [Gordonia sp. L191]|uniref:hypothetical protein n=1 Tax=Gordonia sp. L191 TaxID=2982699 RepID=UPI0024BF951B|nr:hypothetical protein [Gordonia sp. L191]WHU47054.1 hypothetical protein QNM97_24395 [Gordonia sp. L191]